MTYAEPSEAWLFVRKEACVEYVDSDANFGFHGVGRRKSLHYVKRRLLNAHRYTPNFEHLEIPVADVAIVDVLGMCL